MASVTFGGGISQAIGSAGGTTFARNKGGAYFKRKSLGTNPSSVSQTLTRTLIGRLSQYYTNTLSDAERAAWRTFASTNPTINRLGNTTFLSGQQAFSKFSMQTLIGNNVISNTPPASTAVTTVVSIVAVLTADPGGSVVITVNTTGATADERILTFISPPMNNGRNFVSSALRRLGAVWTPDVAETVTADYVTILGSLPTAAGQKAFIRASVVNIVNGVTSPPLQLITNWV